MSLRALSASALSIVVLLAGCSKQLLGGLDETAANQVVSALRLEGISADKSPAGEKGWKVTVADDQLAEAVQIMERRNLPPPQFHGLGQVFKKESLVSTPTEERARLIHAMSQELERSLMEIDGVLVARVHPVILPHDPLNPKRVVATASVLIKYRAGVDMSGREGMVRGLVAAGIEGLNYDDVRVMMVPGEVQTGSAEKTTALAPRSGQRDRLPPQYAGVLAALVAALLLSYVWVRWRRQTESAMKTLQGRWADTVNSVLGDGSKDGSKTTRKRSGAAS